MCAKFQLWAIIYAEVIANERPELGLRPDFKIFGLWFGLPQGSIMCPLFLKVYMVGTCP